MTEITTIKVDKPVVDWLNSIKGLMEYAQSRKLTLNDTMICILGIIDAINAGQSGIIDPFNQQEVEDYINHKIDLFWGAEKEKPVYGTGTPRDWFVLSMIQKQEKDKKQRVKFDFGQEQRE